jgi:hypothetical protein
LACHLTLSQTFTDAQLRASFRAASPTGTATAPPKTAGLSRGWCGLHKASLGATTCPPGHPQHLMSQEGQKDPQGQPPEPLPVHPSTTQEARSVQMHQSWDRETEAIFQSQGHQTVEQPPLTQ